MRIAWFTPYSIKSAIARFSEAVLPELSKYAAVDLWHADGRDARETKLKEVRYQDATQVDLTRLSAYDLVVYNLGNHLPFHREILHVSRMVPGLCILHDFVMHHFFASYYLEEMKNPEAYVSAMDRLYGNTAKIIAEDSLAGKRKRVWETDEVVHYPFFEDAVRSSLGAVTHSEFLRDEVRSKYPGPVCKIPLAYNLLTGGAELTRKDLAIPDKDVLIVTVGHLNPNKRIPAAIDAIASCRTLVPNLTFAVLGPYEPAYHEQLQVIVHGHGLQNVVRFLGYTADDVLRSYLAHADICINLRFPVIEGASASLVEEMLYGKPVIVTDSGFYHELPDNCVVKIHPDREREQLAMALRELATNPDLRNALGATAKRFAEDQFSPARYAKELLQFAWETRNSKPLLQLADKLASELNSMGIYRQMDIVETVSKQCYELFGDGKDPGSTT